MDWQLLTVGGVVFAAAGYLARSAWRTWVGRPKAGCGSGCGGCPTSTVTDNGRRITLPQV
ncbi:MAG: FeoB-associated Cys-rich membrane protein [Gemmataceae bacterium]